MVQDAGHGSSPINGRRDEQRAALVTCAEKAIAGGGLSALKARDLAACVGCSLGAIYNLVRDLDEVVLRVGQRTMAGLDAHLDAASAGWPDLDLHDQLIAWARAYCAFAAANAHRWRALFEFKIAAGAELPPWFADDRARVFARLERRLAQAMPAADPAAVARHARILFSAVHGLVLLGLDQKLMDRHDKGLDAEIVDFVHTYAAGLASLGATSRS